MDLLLLWAMVKVLFEGTKMVVEGSAMPAVGCVDSMSAAVRVSARLLDACLVKGTVRRVPEAE